MTNAVCLSNNIFDRNFLTKKEYIEMIENFIRTVEIIGDNLKTDELLHLDTIPTLVAFGIMEENEEIYDIEKILGKTITKKLLESIYIVNKFDLLNYNEIASYHYITRNQVAKRENELEKPTLIDLFCGSGGLSLGFTQAGFKVVLSNDIEKAAIRTYAFNHPEIDGSKILFGGIESITSNIRNYIDDKVDVIIGGPPCQGFSMANRQRIIDDPRNILYKHYVECVKQVTPKFFIMENVKGMKAVADQVVEDFNNGIDIKYDISFKVLNAKDFGIPQNRERLIYIGVRHDIALLHKVTADDIFNSIEMKYVDSNVSLMDAIKDLKSLEASRIKYSTTKGSKASGYIIDEKSKVKETDYVRRINHDKAAKLVFNHKARYNNDRDIEIFGRMLPGDQSDSPRIADIMPYSHRNHMFKDKYYKLKPDGICKTITAHMKFDCNMYIHPLQARGLTPREAARVQTYPDSYFFLGPYTKTYQQIGNSVPPLMANRIARGVVDYVKHPTSSSLQ